MVTTASTSVMASVAVTPNNKLARNRVKALRNERFPIRVFRSGYPVADRMFASHLRNETRERLAS